MAAWIVTGAAGFIGYHLATRLLADGRPVVGIDSLSDAYDPALAHARLARLSDAPGFTFFKADVADEAAIDHVFERHHPSIVVHLAARSGVRRSASAPLAHVGANVVGFAGVLETCRRFEVGHLVYASSSSVYGATTPAPFSEQHPADRPVSIYAATKRADELLAHAYAHGAGLPTTGLRLFTAYGTWGRPDMAYYRFAEALLDGEPVTIYGSGDAQRDFTYVGDVVEAIVRVAALPPRGANQSHRPSDSPGAPLRAPSPRPGEPTGHTDRHTPRAGRDDAPWRILNVGRGRYTTVHGLIDALERVTGRTATRVHVGEQSGDVPRTLADVGALADLTGYSPTTDLDDGLARFVAWLRAHRR